MDIHAFDYELPESLIAQTPLKERTHSRLMFVDKNNGHIEHHRFEQLNQFLQRGDLLVLNDTKVLPARLIGAKQDTGGVVELLLLNNLGADRWEVLVKPARRVKVGNVIAFRPTASGTDGSPTDPLLTAVVEEEKEMGGRIVRLEYDGIFQEILDVLGSMPLPPYIKEQLDEKERYQTVYAKHEGSAAAPTAGLHFTEAYLQQLQAKGVSLAYVTLHVGLGTFRPVSVEQIEEHEMHSEYYMLSSQTAEAIARTRATGGRIIAVGTTSARTLEAVAQRYEGELKPSEGWTNIFIYPGYRFLAIDGLITNFHLPKSTLLMLVSALAGTDTIINAYKEAVDERYRFFSFGDAMVII